MPRSNRKPITEPQIITLPDGSGSVTTTYDLGSGDHEVICDLCGSTIVLNPQANAHRFFQHRGKGNCRSTAAKARQRAITAEADAARTALFTTTPALPNLAHTVALSTPQATLTSALPSSTTSSSLIQPFTLPQTPIRAAHHNQTPYNLMLPPPAPFSLRYTDRSDLSEHNASSSRYIETISSVLASPSINNPLDQSRPPVPDEACPGVRVLWTAGSIGLTYPFQQHNNTKYKLSFSPCGYIIENNQEVLLLRSDKCRRYVSPVSKGSDPTYCTECAKIPHSAQYNDMIQRAKQSKPHTPWDYLNENQCRELMEKLQDTTRILRVKLRNLERRFSTMKQKLSDIQRITILLSMHEVAGLRRLFAAAIKRGASLKMLVFLLEQAIAGFYTPRGLFNERELDISFLVKAIAGPRLLYALNKSHGLASVSTVKRYRKVPQLLASIGVPTAEEASMNIRAFMNPDIKPLPSYESCSVLPGMILMIDGVAIETKCQYDAFRNAVIGLGREYAGRVNTQVNSLEDIEHIQNALDLEKDDPGYVAYGTEATVAAIAPYARTDHYTPVPIIASSSCKTEKADALAEWLDMILQTWKKHQYGEEMHGAIWAIASDGDSTYRRAKAKLCLKHELNKESALGKLLCPLKGLNCYTGDDELTLTCDPKHVMKRFATLLRNQKGIVIGDTILNPVTVIQNLSKLPKMTQESALQLLDPSDKQNVPRATKLIQLLQGVKSLPPALSPAEVKNRHILDFFAKTLHYFVEPFINVTMNLSEQILSLATYAHLAAALQIKHGSTCFTGPLYADSQAVVKNIIFTVGKMQCINPELEFYIILEGTDRLEMVFSDCRTQDHSRNFDIKQLAEKIAVGTLVNAAFERNPDLDRGHRRLSLKDAMGIDHCNIKSWEGDVKVKGVILYEIWQKAKEKAIEMLREYLGESAVIDFDEIFSRPDHDLLRPTGVYVGMKESADDVRSEEETTTLEDLTRIASAEVVHTMPTEMDEATRDTTQATDSIILPDNAPNQDTAHEYIPGAISHIETNIHKTMSETTEDTSSDGDIEYDPGFHAVQKESNLDFESDCDDVPEGLSLDDYLSDSVEDPENIENGSGQDNRSMISQQNETTTIDVSKPDRFLTIEGRKYLKSSVVASFLSSRRSRKVTMRTLRARGVAIEDLRQNNRILNSTELDSEDVVKAGDIIACLSRTGKNISLSILELKGFQVENEKATRICIEMTKLESPDDAKGIKAIAQVLELKYIDNADIQAWQWTGSYLQLVDSTTTQDISTHRYFVVHVPAILLQPISATISEYKVPLSSNSPASTTMKYTWTLKNEDLVQAMDDAWSKLSPESEEILGNVKLLPVISNETILPYRDTKGNSSLFIQNLPPHLQSQKKLASNEKVPCYLCGRTYSLGDMRNHVGWHILYMTRSLEDPFGLLDGCEISGDACGFCGLTGCVTQLIQKGTKASITSSCPYHYEKMQYSSAKQSSKNTPCTNVPIHCQLCPVSASGIPRTIWKYNAVFHLASDHSTQPSDKSKRRIMPTVPSQMIVDMFISSKEEGMMKISREVTDEFRDYYDLPGSEAVAEKDRELEAQRATQALDGKGKRRPRAPSSPTNSSRVQHPPVRAQRGH